MVFGRSDALTDFRSIFGVSGWARTWRCDCTNIALVAQVRMDGFPQAAAGVVIGET
jgi:hypothetical protein